MQYPEISHTFFRGKLIIMICYLKANQIQQIIAAIKPPIHVNAIRNTQNLTIQYFLDANP